MSPPIRLFATDAALVLKRGDRSFRALPGLTIDALFTAENPVALAEAGLAGGDAIPAGAPLPASALRAPIASQEVWAAGVTYLRSRTARMEESKDAGGGSFYDRVYAAERPELFFKATPHRVAAPGGAVRIRRDSRWNVPEPELTLAIDSRGRIFGYTIGNDMSSRDIEGENPLYLPQAKVYAGCAALGPCLVVTRDLPGPDAVIALEIRRAGAPVFSGRTEIGRIKRPLPSLADWLFRENTFPHGCFLMTGTGIVPPDTFTLQTGDEIRITLDPVGTLTNVVA
jgi:2-dehydro-3-deoxy-D-arabinonate dehydratase